MPPKAFYFLFTVQLQKLMTKFSLVNQAPVGNWVKIMTSQF